MNTKKQCFELINNLQSAKHFRYATVVRLRSSVAQRVCLCKTLLMRALINE